MAVYNLGRMTTTTTGTGTITLGAAVSGYLSFAGAGVSDGDTVHYGISDGANSEMGTGTYTASGTTLTRTVEDSTNAGAAISLSGSAEVFITPTAAALLFKDTADQTISGGARVTSLSDGTKSSGTYTPDPGDRPLIYITNGGAFTLAAPTAGDGSFVLLVTNNGSAGAITFSGFQVGSNVGDALTTTNGDDFAIYITRINSISFYFIQALQ